MKHTLTVIAFTLLAVGCIALFGFRHEQSGPVYQYRQFSTVESIIPGGLGRSRVIETNDSGSEVEKELKNFYSLVGINFSNITQNDRVIVERINAWTNEGWELHSVTTGVQSPSVSDNGNSTGGIFITRYLFRKVKG